MTKKSINDMIRKLYDVTAELRNLHTMTSVLGDGVNDVQLSSNFNLREFECRHCGSAKVDPRLVKILQNIRDEVGGPIVITSAYRCPTHNANVRGAINSQHIEGTAVDIRSPKITLQELATIAEKYVQNDGFGVYENHIHIDTRGYRARW